MTPKRLYVYTLISSAMLILVMTFLFYLGNKLLIERTSLIEATEKIKLHATTAHLWFEEIMGGDKTESIEGVWEDMQSADWYAKVMLDGGANVEGTYYPLTDPLMRQLIVEVRNELTKFREIAQRRYDHFENSLPGSDIDTQFDKVFIEFIDQANIVETRVKEQIHAEYRQYQVISFSLIFISAIISFFLSNFLFKREKLRASLVDSLTEAKESIAIKNRELHKLAHYDALTGLPNRILFLDRLDQSIVHAKRTKSAAALLFIDLDRFKAVNDQYGHQSGDQLLQQVSQRLTHCIRNDDTAVRISGDEFIIILNELSNVSTAVNSANKIAEKLINSLQEPFKLHGPTVYITASIGISIYPEDGNNGEDLTKYADNAMYHAKALGKNNFQFYSEELNQQSVLRLETENDLRQAIQEDQFILHFHPQWHIQSGDISGLEALVRWQHPKRGLVFPDEFIGVAETCGLIQSLDKLIFEKAMSQHQQWQQSGLDFGIISVNVSPISFCHKDFILSVRKTLTRFEVNPCTIEFEILESVLVENNENSGYVLKQLQQLGIKVAIDDFGTGYSSMAYLKDFEVDTLKIDRSFTMDLVKNNTSKNIIKNMISLGNDLGLKVIAEGIEESEQEDILKQFGCDIGQGYLVTKPLPAEALAAFLKGKKHLNVINFKTSSLTLVNSNSGI